MDSKNIVKTVNANRESFLKRYQLYLPAVIAIVLLFVFGQILSTGFASIKNISTIMASASILAVAAMGQSFVIFGGEFGIDLSLGAVMSLGAMLTPILTQGVSERLPLTIVIIMLFGAAVGLINGLGVQLIKIPPLAMTLIMATVVDGFTLAYTQGQPSLVVPKILKTIGKPIFGQIRLIFVIAIILVVLIQLFLQKSSYGRSLFLVGSNRRAAYLAGIRVNLVVVLSYMIASAIACTAGVLMVGFVGSGQLQMGDQYTMMSVAAVVIGGAKLSGGCGSLGGSTLGSIVIILLTSILVAVGLSAGVRTFFQGVILVVILLFNSRAPKLRA